jgi:hypothetical protein
MPVHVVVERIRWQLHQSQVVEDLFTSGGKIGIEGPEYLSRSCVSAWPRPQ